MRVTKTVREYIEKEVVARMERKYADEAAEAKRQNDLYNQIEEKALQTAAEAYEVCVRSMIQSYKAEDYLELPEGVKLTHAYRSNPLRLAHNGEYNSVLSWRRRMQEEAKKKCDDIIVTLELGGTKAELLQMLSEI